jgi:two-component system, NarL family, invasion response regulator UvrY
MEKKRIIIVDDRPLLRDAWTVILENDGKWVVIDAVPKSKVSIILIQSTKPNLILLEITIPLKGDIKLIKLIRRYSPLTRVIAISLHLNQSYSNQILRAGAKGYINPECKADELLKTVELVSKGRIYVCNELDGTFLKSKPEVNLLGKLTSREVEIIQLLRKGLSSKEIAVKIFITPRTVDAHRYKILRKLHVKNSTALIQMLNEFGI